MTKVPDEAIRRCACGCGAPLSVRQRLYVSPRHRARRTLVAKLGKGPLATFLWQVMCDKEIGQTALANLVGVDSGTIGNLLQDRTPTERTYQRLKDHLGDGVPKVATDTERRREVCLGRVPELVAAAHTPQAIARNAAAQRGQKYPKRSAAYRKYIDDNRAAGVDVVGWRNPNLGAWTQSEEGRVRMSLGQRLRRTPAPDRAALAQWAAEVGARFGLPAKSVMDAWEPTLRDRRLLPKKGRPSLEARHRLVAELLVGWTLPSGRVKRGFWPHAAEAVSRQEGETISSATLNRWWYRHEASCTLSAEEQRELDEAS